MEKRGCLWYHRENTQMQSPWKGENTMTKHEQRAKELFLEGYNCAQAVLLAFASEVGLDEATSAKLASSFGGGLGGMRQVCGAVSGMCMAAGLLYGGGTAPEGRGLIRRLLGY